MTTTAPTRAASKVTYHSQWIDLLRGISALAVVLFHVRVDLWVGWKQIHAAPANYSTIDRAAAFLSLATPFFGSAVMLFFLVSGFCVHFSYAANGRPFEFGSYIGRRFFRIYPPYLAIIGIALLCESIAFALYRDPTSSLTTIVKSVFMVQNYGAWAGQMVSNPSLWSLPVEAELYIVYPIFLWGCLRLGYKKALILVALASATGLLLSLRFEQDNGFFRFGGNFLIYWIIWCAGATLAEALKRERLPRWNAGHGVMMVLALGAALFASLKDVPVGVQQLTWASFYFMLMLWGLANPIARYWPERLKAPLLSLGVISYSLYLIHFPFFRLCGAIWQHQFASKPANFLIPLCFVALSLPLAALFYRWIELPSHALARKFGAPRARPHQKNEGAAKTIQ